MVEIDKKTYTIPEAAKVLGIGINAAYTGVKTGEIPSIQIGRRKVVPVVALDRLLSGKQSI